MKESQSTYEIYILSKIIQYFPDHSIDQKNFESNADEDTPELLRLETIFILSNQDSYIAEQVLESTGITLQNEMLASEIWEDLEITSDDVEKYPFDPPLELLELNDLSLDEFLSKSNLTCWSIHWYVSGPFNGEKALIFDGWYLDFYQATKHQMPESEWSNFVWPESILTKTLSYRSTAFTDYPFEFDENHYFARVRNDSILGEKITPLHPDDFARLNCEALSYLLTSSNELPIDSLRTQLEDINLGATQGFLFLRKDFDDGDLGATHP